MKGIIYPFVCGDRLFLINGFYIVKRYSGIRQIVNEIRKVCKENEKENYGFI